MAEDRWGAAWRGRGALAVLDTLSVQHCSEGGFAWRQFANRRQVGAIVGLTPTPYDSGKAHREQGISKVLLVLQRLDLGIGQLPAGKLTQQPLPNPGAISAVID